MASRSTSNRVATHADSFKRAVNISRSTCSEEEIIYNDAKGRILREKARRGTAWAIFFNLEGSMTGIKLLVREAVISPLAWGNMALYIALRVRNSLADSYEATVSSSYLGGISSFMAFFVIFYANQCYGRFWSQYSMCQQCLDAVCDGTLTARYEMKDDEASFKRFIRLINAAHSIGFTGLRSGYNFDNFFKPFNAQYQVLTSKDLDALSKISQRPGGDRECFYTLLSWATDTAGKHASSQGSIQGLRKGMSALWELEAEPIPFAYIWAMFLLSWLYLIVLAVYLSQFKSTRTEGRIIDEFIAAVIIVLNNIFVVGLPRIGAGLSSAVGPYEIADLSLRRYVTMAMEFSLSSKTTPRYQPDIELEAQIESKSPAVHSTPMAEFFDDGCAGVSIGTLASRGIRRTSSSLQPSSEQCLPAAQQAMLVPDPSGLVHTDAQGSVTQVSDFSFDTAQAKAAAEKGN